MATEIKSGWPFLFIRRSGLLAKIATQKTADTTIGTFARAYNLVVSSDKLSANGWSSPTSRLFVTAKARIS